MKPNKNKIRRAKKLQTVGLKNATIKDALIAHKLFWNPIIKNEPWPANMGDNVREFQP